MAIYNYSYRNSYINILIYTFIRKTNITFLVFYRCIYNSLHFYIYIYIYIINNNDININIINNNYKINNSNNNNYIINNIYRNPRGYNGPMVLGNRRDTKESAYINGLAIHIIYIIYIYIYIYIYI